MKSIPSKKTTLTLLDTTYEVNFPTTGQYIAIQNLKGSLASNYDALKFQGAESQYAETLVDAIAHFSVLCPKMVESLAKPIQDLDMIQSKEIVEVYTNQFRSWYNEGLNFVFQVNKKDESK